MRLTLQLPWLLNLGVQNLMDSLLLPKTEKRPYQDRSLSINQICKTLGISRPTFYRYLAPPDATAKGAA